jgi:serine/threonine protein kinase
MRLVELWYSNVNNHLIRYEMLCGIPPFYNENQERMYELIKLSELRFPKKIKISSEAQDIISRVKITKISSLIEIQAQD